MDSLGVIADRLLGLVAPRRTAAAQSCVCLQTCYCSGGLRYARYCNCCQGFCAGSCQAVGIC